MPYKTTSRNTNLVINLKKEFVNIHVVTVKLIEPNVNCPLVRFELRAFKMWEHPADELDRFTQNF